MIAGLVVCKLTGHNLMHYFVADSNKILAIGTAVATFIFFANAQISYSRIINGVASSVFGVLLIHANSDAMRQCLWKDLLRNTDAYAMNIGAFIAHSLMSVLGIYVFCVIIDQIRINSIEKPFMKVVKKCKWVEKSIIRCL